MSDRIVPLEANADFAAANRAAREAGWGKLTFAEALAQCSLDPSLHPDLYEQLAKRPQLRGDKNRF